MTILTKNLRNVVEFDPANRDHRLLFADFIKSNTWGHMPYRFTVSDTIHIDLASAIQEKLLKYYLSKEFDKIKA